MKKFQFIMLIAFMIVLPSYSQIRDISVIKKGVSNKSTKLVLAPQQHKKGGNVKEKEEFALYRDIVRKYTWMEGRGEQINQETANHLPFYYKFSMKNAKGHWQHIEAMHGSKMTTNHDQSTYVLDKNFDEAGKDSVWMNRLKTVSQWFVSSDLDGDMVVEERAYTADGDMVYSMMPIKNADGKVTCCYNDAWGLPADMREDSTTTYGSVVCITYDHCGRDSVIDFLDGQGLRKYNSNGVDQQQYTYDENDRIIQTSSHNVVGDYIVDNWGNCGNNIIYDDKNNKYSIIRFDAELTPMRMPSNRVDGTRTFIRCDITKDKWGRISKMEILDEKGNPDTTLSGLHEILYKYNDNGILLSKSFFDIKGNEMTKEEACKNLK